MDQADPLVHAQGRELPELFTQAKTAFRSGQFEDLCAAHREIGRLSSIYTIGDDFVTTIKAAVAAKFGGLEPVSRGYGGALDDTQLGAVKRLFGV